MMIAKHTNSTRDKDKELTHTQMETNTLENLKMICITDKELSRGQVESLLETNTLVNGKMKKGTEKGFIRGQMERLKKVSGKMEN